MRNKKLSLVILLLIVISLPLLVLVIKHQTQTRSNAAAADKLEAESGTLGGNAIPKTDSQASGGSYIELVTNQISPTITPQSSNKIGPQPVNSTPISQGTKFASPTGTGSTCSSSSPCSLTTATNNAAAGDIVFLRGGIYSITSNIYFRGNGTPNNYITFESYPGELAILDGSSLSAGTQIYIRITGSYNKLRKFEIRNMPMQGIWIGGNYNILDGLDVHHNKLSGIHIFSPYEAFPYGQYGSYNQILNSKAHDNSDAYLGGAGQDFNRGGNADGISISSGEGNIVKNVLIERNSDDGFDSWRSTNTKISHSISTANGIDQGNGDGIKAGGASPSNGTIVEHSIAYKNKGVGFDTNSGLNVTFNFVTSWTNGVYGFYTYSTTKISNSISVGHTNNFGGNGTQTNNSWQRSGTPTFISTDPSSVDFLKPTTNGFTDIGAYAN